MLTGIGLGKGWWSSASAPVQGFRVRVLQRSLILAIILIYFALVFTMKPTKTSGAKEQGILRERIDL